MLSTSATLNSGELCRSVTASRNAFHELNTAGAQLLEEYRLVRDDPEHEFLQRGGSSVVAVVGLQDQSIVTLPIGELPRASSRWVLR